jgi:antitoxin HicB
MKTKKSIGSSFDSFLQEENILAESEAVATKRVIAYQVEEAIKTLKVTKSDMAKRMNTSRAALDRLLDPNNTSITLATIENAANAIGRRVRVEIF